MLRNKFLWIGMGVIIAVVAIGGYFYGNNQSVAAAEEPELQTSTVRRGSIVISATGAGTVVPVEELALSFPSAGVLTSLYVSVGDEVALGDLLATIDDGDAQKEVASAELQLAQSIMQTDAAGTATGVSYNEIAVEQAKIAFEEAQTALDDLLNWEPDEDEIAQAEASLAAAEASYNAARGQEAASATNITVNNISLEQAQRKLDDAQAAYDTAFDPGREWEFGIKRMADALEAEREAAIRNLQSAEDSLAVAQANYNASVSSTNNSSSTSAESNVLSAELALQTALEGPTEDEIVAAETAVRQAELVYQQALLNQEADQISLAQAELSLESAQQALTDTQLYAPADGTIMSVSSHVGEQVSGTFITLADLERPLLELFMDETDLDKVGVGFEVEVIFDALPDETFAGTIIQVDPMLSEVSGVSVLRAVVALDEFAKPQTLPVGLNATVDVIGGRAENALIVPVEAVREIAPDQYAVFVVEDGEPKMQIVEVGLMDFTFAEILFGLEQGDVVSTGIVDTGQ